MLIDKDYNWTGKTLLIAEDEEINYIFIERKSDEYHRVLATAKYLMTDNSFPLYFVKRSEQVYLNTWHGTPLKVLGRSDISSMKNFGNP